MGRGFGYSAAFAFVLVVASGLPSLHTDRATRISRDILTVSCTDLLVIWNGTLELPHAVGVATTTLHGELADASRLDPFLVTSVAVVIKVVGILIVPTALPGCPKPWPRASSRLAGLDPPNPHHSVQCLGSPSKFRSCRLGTGRTGRHTPLHTRARTSLRSRIGVAGNPADRRLGVRFKIKLRGKCLETRLGMTGAVNWSRRVAQHFEVSRLNIAQRLGDPSIPHGPINLPYRDDCLDRRTTRLMAAQFCHGDCRALRQAEPLCDEPLDPTHSLWVGAMGIKQSAHAHLPPTMSPRERCPSHRQSKHATGIR